MARSSTSFQPGNTAGFKPGNRLALRHGARSVDVVRPQAAELEARIRKELEELPQTKPVDDGLVEIHAFMEAQARIRMHHARRTGGLWTTRGTLKKGGKEFLALVYRIHESSKVLGIGAAPRAGMLRDMADARSGMIEVQAAQERLRAKYPPAPDG